MSNFFPGPCCGILRSDHCHQGLQSSHLGFQLRLLWTSASIRASLHHPVMVLHHGFMGTFWHLGGLDLSLCGLHHDHLPGPDVHHGCLGTRFWDLFVTISRGTYVQFFQGTYQGQMLQGQDSGILLAPVPGEPMPNFSKALTKAKPLHHDL